MEIHYEVTRSDYIKLIRQQLKNYNKSFKGRLVFFLTNGAFAAAAAYLFLMKHNETGFSKILPVILAVTIWIMNIHRRYSYNRRAEILFEKLIQNGLLIKEYLGEHQLYLENNKIIRKMGAREDGLSLNSIIRIQNTDNMLLLYTGREIFEIIPDCNGQNRKNKEILEKMFQNVTLENKIETC